MSEDNEGYLPLNKCFGGCILARLILENANLIAFEDLLDKYQAMGFMCDYSDLIEQLDLLFDDHLIEIIENNTPILTLTLDIQKKNQKIQLTKLGLEKTKEYAEAFKKYPELEQSIFQSDIFKHFLMIPRK